jgi:hypothetical protein
MNFPSGRWTGFYNYGAGVRRHRMDLVLTFASQTISGDGCDDVGQFVVTGRFDETSGECHWTKTYVGAHDVYYRGFREGKGIWGVWKLGKSSGGFRIWPVQEGEGENEEEEREEPLPAEAVVPRGA